MPNRPAILFVDDEPNVLSGLRRMLRGKAAEWAMAFAGSGDEALRLLDERRYDAVVTDMRMPRMDGAELLALVARRHPQAVRIILSGQCDQEAALKSVGPSHVFLSKPCEPGLLIETLERAMRLRRIIFDTSVRNALGGLNALPSLPLSYLAISHAMEDPNCSAHTISDLVAKDPAVAAELLHVANSAYFAPRREVTSIHQAVQYLGMDVVRAVVLSSSVFKALAEQVRDPAYLAAVWEHSLRTAARMRAALHALADAMGQPKPDLRAEGEAYSAGLLHDVGLLALAAALPEGDQRLNQLADVCECRRAAVERAALGADHGVVGGFLMGLWGLPDAIVEAIALHHAADACFAASSPLPRVVCIASAVDNLVEEGASLDQAAALLAERGALPQELVEDPAALAVIRAAWNAA